MIYCKLGIHVMIFPGFDYISAVTTHTGSAFLHKMKTKDPF